MHCADIARAAAVGIGATLCMDLWNLFLRRVASASPGGVGEEVVRSEAQRNSPGG